jgi:hypothetical protein
MFIVKTLKKMAPYGLTFGEHFVETTTDSALPHEFETIHFF